MINAVFNYVQANGDQIAYYTAAGVLMASPIWMPSVAEINQYIPFLTFVVGAIGVGARWFYDHKIYKSRRKPRKR